MARKCLFGSLKHRQGSARYIQNAVDRYSEIPTANIQLVNDMRVQIATGRIESFASLNRNERLAQFNLRTFTDGIGANLNANRYFINKNVGR